LKDPEENQTFYFLYQCTKQNADANSNGNAVAQDMLAFMW